MILVSEIWRTSLMAAQATCGIEAASMSMQWNMQIPCSTADAYEIDDIFDGNSAPSFLSVLLPVLLLYQSIAIISRLNFLHSS